MTKKLIIPNTKNIEVWFAFINDNLEYISINTLPTKLVVDLNNIEFLETDNLVLLACLLESYYETCCEISFIGGSKNLNVHLDNIKFKEYWQKNTDRKKIVISRNRTTLCLWKIDKETMFNYSLFAQKYYKTQLNGLDLSSITSSLDEVFNNIFDHSKCNFGGYVITQYFPKINKLSFSICDFGIGIAKSINNYNKENNIKQLQDFEAILNSTNLGVSVKSTPRNRGFGLNNILEFTESSNGSLSIYSNKGSLVKESTKPYILNNLKNNFNGTLIKVRVDLDTFEDLETSYDDYEF